MGSESHQLLPEPWHPAPQIISSRRGALDALLTSNYQPSFLHWEVTSYTAERKRGEEKGKKKKPPVRNEMHQEVKLSATPQKDSRLCSQPNMGDLRCHLLGGERCLCTW